MFFSWTSAICILFLVRFLLRLAAFSLLSSSPRPGRQCLECAAHLPCSLKFLSLRRILFAHVSFCFFSLRSHRFRLFRFLLLFSSSVSFSCRDGPIAIFRFLVSIVSLCFRVLFLGPLLLLSIQEVFLMGFPTLPPVPYGE